VTDERLHELACRAGALVLGEPGSTQQYMLSLAELARFVEMAQQPCMTCAVRNIGNWYRPKPAVMRGPYPIDSVVPPVPMCPVPLPPQK
jgi:hypothetical protein